MKRPKNIIICTDTYPPDTGGIAAFSRDLKYLFEEMNWEVDVYKAKSPKVKSKYGIFKNYIISFFKFYNKISKTNSKIIFSTRIQPFGLLSVLVKPLIKSKIIIQVHGTEIEGRYKKGWRKLLYQLVYNNADQIWANSKNTVNRLKKFGVNSNKIKLVYPFLTNDITDIELNHILQDKPSTFRIFTAGALYPRKGIDLVLHSLSRLKDFEWEYVIAGQARNEYKGYYEKLAKKLKISDRVKFLGQIERENVWLNMKMADLFVLTSRELSNDIESFGIVYIEAQYFGTPCIGTNTGGIPEAIGEGGFLIENENISQLEKNLRKLIMKQDLSEISTIGKERVRKKFLSQSRAEEVIRYLKEINIV